MSTRAVIIKQNKDNALDGVYVDSDGDLSSTGQTLWDSYRRRSQVDKLFGHGDIFQLGDVTDIPRASKADRLFTKYAMHGQSDPLKQVDPKNSHEFKALPKNEQRALSELFDTDFTDFLDTSLNEVRNSTSRHMHWKDLNDLEASIKGHDDRFPSMFIDFAYLYTKNNTWRFFYSYKNGIHTKKTLYNAL